MTPRRNRLVVLLFAAVAAFVASFCLPAFASAAEPNITLVKQAPETALLGSKQKVNLKAANPKGEKRGYNLTFRDVLPKGVKYVAGSAPEAPRVIANAPEAGKTTLIFEDVADLSGYSEYNLPYEVEAEASAYTVGGSFTNLAEAFVTRKPRNKPVFNAKGEAEGSSYTGSAKAEATTKLSAIEITKSEPSPEGEILRGVHQHQTVYTLTVKNNALKPTKEVSVEDFLPAGLEYLACDEADNTTNATGTNPGSTEEYPGSGPINAAGNIPTTTNCLKPTEVETEEVDPPGPQPKGIYTHVTWKGLGELAAGAERKIQYIAAVPLRRNALFSIGTKPTAASLKQAANLDNNTGSETVDEEALTNVAQAKGIFVGGPKAEEQIPVSDTEEITRTAEDLAIQKSVDKPGISEGQISIWTMKIETSEYRYVNNIRVDDVVPNGLCPLGVVNYEKPIQLLAECNPTGNEPSAEYTNVEEQANGTFKIHWDQSTDAQLAQMPPSSTIEINYPTRNRIDYQENFENAKPILTGDSWINKVNIVGENFSRCAPNDPTCTKGQPKINPHGREGEPVFDESEAGQQAGGVTIDKTVRVNNTETVPVNCSGTYVQGTPPGELPDYRPGDKVCWQLRVNFASDLYSGTPTVTDFLPPNEKYIAGSAQKTTNNNVESTINEAEAEGGSLEWTLGESVESGSKVFEVRFMTEMQKALTPASAPEEITGNLMKFTYSNTAGKTFPLRDRAEIERNEPKLKLEKRVASVSGGTSTINAEGNAIGSRGGQNAKYSISIKNEGNLEAKAVETWDTLPSGLKCESVVGGSISDGGTCAAGTSTIKWTGLALAVGETHALTYEMTIPSNVAPLQEYKNEAGVTQYQSETNKGPSEPFHYYPGTNIAGKTFEVEHAPNVGPIRDSAIVSTAAVGFAKTRVTTVEQPGNNPENQATIGEGVKYTITTVVPAGSELYGSPTVKDPLGTRLALVPGTVKGSVNGVAIPTGGFEAVEEGGNPVLKFPATYANPPGSGDDTIKLEFEAKVTDVATNARSVGEGKLINEAKLAYNDQNGVAQSKAAQAITTIVEPVLGITKTNAGGSVVKPGQTVQYTVTATNAAEARVSTANDTTVVDTVPAGMTPVNGSTPIAEGGKVEPNEGIWNAEKRTITWTVAEIAPGAGKELKYSLLVNKPANAGSTFKNTAVDTTTSLKGSVPGERTSSSSSHAGYEASAEDTVTLNEAELEKEVKAPKGQTIGDPLEYTLHFKLPPQIAFFDTTVEDHLPKGVAYDGTSSITCEPGCEGLATGATTLKPSTEEGSPLLGWYFGAIPAAEVERTITISYKAHIAQELEAGKKVVDKNVLTNKAIGLYNGSTKNPVPTEPPPRSSFTNKTGEASTSTKVTEPELTINKSVTGATAAPKTQPGDQLVYTIEVTNIGDTNAYDTVVEDNNPNPAGGLGAVDPSTGEGHEYLAPEAGKPLRWVIPGPIKPAVTQKLTYKATLKPSEKLSNGETVPNTANIPVYFGAPEAQRKEEGVGRFREYTENPSHSVSLEVALPKLQLKKTAGPKSTEEAEALIGEPFEWHLEVKNLSTVASLKNVKLLDTLPKGWEYIAGSAEVSPGGTKPTASVVTNGAGEQEITWQNVANLGPSGSATLTFKATPTTSLVGKEGVYTNTATATGEDQSGASKSAEGPYSSTSTAKANLKTPPLTIVKKPDEGEAGAKAVAGKTSAYTIAITNNGQATATEVKVTDLLDHGNVYTPGPETGASAEPSTGFSEVGSKTVEPKPGEKKTEVTWAITQIPAKSTVTIKVPVSLEASLAEGTKLHDVASVVSKQQPLPESDQGTLEISREADLRIKKSGPAEVVPGEDATYKLEVENIGPSNAAAVEISDPVPAGTKFVSAQEPCALVGGEVICKLEEMKPGPSYKREVEVKLEVLSGTTGNVVNKATVSSPTPDPEPANNKSEVTSTTKPLNGLVIVKRGPSAPVLLGSTFEYEIEVENRGPSDAVGVEVTDPLPPEVELVEAETRCVGGEPREFKCALGTIVAKTAPTTLHFKVKAIGIPAEGAPVHNVATVKSATESKTAEAETTVLPAADLAITKTAPATVEPNGELTYKLHVENLGPSIAHKVTITDPLPAGVEFVTASTGCANAAGVVTCAVQPKGELAVGGTADFLVTVHVPFTLGGQPLTNTASVKGEEADPNTGNDQSTVTTIVGPAADLSITKTMGKAEAGKPLTYTLAVTNKGPSASSAVTVKDTLPAGTTFKTAAPSQGTCGTAGQEVTCQLGELAASASAQVSITVEVGATVTGTLRNTAKVEGPEPDPDKSNNESSVEGPVTPAPLVSTGTPNLRVLKTADTATPQVGTPFDYQVTVSNMGGAEAKEVKVVDTLNGPAKVLSIETESGKCEANGSRINCTIPSIPVGKTVHITYSVVAEAAGPLSNTASAQAANGETAPANNHAVKGVRAKAGQANFTLTKTAAKKVVDGGKKVAFTITLRNGPTALVNATICDRLPAALVFVKAAGASFVKGEACWQKKFVAAKRTLKLHLTARAVRGYKPRKARNVASASAENAPGAKHASATVRIKPAFAGAPGGVTG